MTPHQRLLFRSVKDWRAWLLANAKSRKEAWLLHYKKGATGKSISYHESVREAICFGWIDSLVKRVDDRLFERKFLPRKNSEAWSKLNIERAKRMVSMRRMTPAGEALLPKSLRFRKTTRRD